MNTQLFASLTLWVHNPTTTAELGAILSHAELSDLLEFLAVESVSPEVGTLVWAEIGRRKGYFQFELLTSSTSGQLKLELKGTSHAVSQPTLRAKRKA